jgi:hypothetical protein
VVWLGGLLAAVRAARANIELATLEQQLKELRELVKG